MPPKATLPTHYCYRARDNQVWSWTPQLEAQEGMVVIDRDTYLAWKANGKLPSPPQPRSVPPPSRPDPGEPVRRKRVDVSSVKEGIWKGHRAFVVGSGPSLMDFDFSLLEGELVVGVNRSGEFAPASITYSLDSQFIDMVWNGTLANAQRALDFYMSPTIRVQAITNDTRPEQLNEQDLCLNKILPHHVMAETFADGIGHGQNSGFGALNLAILLGANPIYLLGFDMGAPTVREAHFHEEYPWHNDVHAESELRAYEEKRIPHFELAAHWIKKHTRVINLNPDSSLRSFDFSDIDHIHWGRQRPLVVSYFTENTGYEAEARDMQASAQLFGLRCDVQPVPDLGGWQANTTYKAEFLERMLKKHDRAICWLDADARVRQYPKAFDEFCEGDYDFGYCVFEWDRIKATRRTRHELSTGVLLLKPTPAVFKLLSDWQSLNEVRKSRKTAVLEQQNLQDLLDKRGIGTLKPFKIPMDHNQIFDHMSELGDPVIEQMQASRRLKKVVGK